MVLQELVSVSRSGTSESSAEISRQEMMLRQHYHASSGNHVSISRILSIMIRSLCDRPRILCHAGAMKKSAPKLVGCAVVDRACFCLCGYFAVERDMKERGRPLDHILHQYLTYVKPAFEEFCLPVSKSQVLPELLGPFGVLIFN